MSLAARSWFATKRLLAAWLSPHVIDRLTVGYWRTRNALSIPYEPERDQLARFVDRAAWVVAAGVNMGQYAAELGKLVGRGGKVIGFEASTATWNLSRRILCGPPYELHNLALGDSPGPVTVARYAGASGLINTGISRISTASDPAAAEIERVQCVRLDDALAGRAKPIAFFQCDVEGFELHVLQGAARVLSEDRPTLLVEVHSAEYFAELVQLLAPLRYGSYRLAADGRWRPTETFALSSTNNVLFVPEHRVAQAGL